MPAFRGLLAQINSNRMSSLKKKPPCRVSFELRQAARSSSCTIGGWLKRSRQCLTASMGGISRPRERSIGHIRVHSGGPETVFLTCSNEPRRPSHVPRGASACMHKPFRLGLLNVSNLVFAKPHSRLEAGSKTADCCALHAMRATFHSDRPSSPQNP